MKRLDEKGTWREIIMEKIPRRYIFLKKKIKWNEQTVGIRVITESDTAAWNHAWNLLKSAGYNIENWMLMGYFKDIHDIGYYGFKNRDSRKYVYLHQYPGTGEGRLARRLGHFQGEVTSDSMSSGS